MGKWGWGWRWKAWEILQPESTEPAGQSEPCDSGLDESTPRVIWGTKRETLLLHQDLHFQINPHQLRQQHKVLQMIHASS